MFIRVIIILLLATNLYSQTYLPSVEKDIFPSTDNRGEFQIPKCKLKQTTTFEKILYTELAVISYGVIDYIGYNLLKNKNEGYWRFCQGVLFSTINYLLNKYVSTGSAIGFSIQVFGGVPDGVYYGIDRIGKGFNGFSHGNEFNLQKDLNHLNFMPTVFGSKHVKGIDLITNVILTTTISIAIQF